MGEIVVVRSDDKSKEKSGLICLMEKDTLGGGIVRTVHLECKPEVTSVDLEVPFVKIGFLPKTHEDKDDLKSGICITIETLLLLFPVIESYRKDGFTFCEDDHFGLKNDEERGVIVLKLTMRK
ncbi:MAG: hypothetical protein WC663_05855 [Patescibacteria group bacterium]